jgi:hypothetical protein
MRQAAWPSMPKRAMQARRILAAFSSKVFFWSGDSTE